MSLIPNGFDVVQLFKLFAPGMTTQRFRTNLVPFLGHFTDHFIHEFWNFAMSQRSIMTYDSLVPYIAYFDEIASLSTDSEDEDHEIAKPLRAVQKLHLKRKRTSQNARAAKRFKKNSEIMDNSATLLRIVVVKAEKKVSPFRRSRY